MVLVSVRTIERRRSGEQCIALRMALGSEHRSPLCFCHRRPHLFVACCCCSPGLICSLLRLCRWWLEAIEHSARVGYDHPSRWCGLEGLIQVVVAGELDLSLGASLGDQGLSPLLLGRLQGGERGRVGGLIDG